MTRIDGRKENELRPVAMTTGFVDFAEGSVLIQCGRTKVLCCASVEEGAPRHVPEGSGWVTASKLKLSPRSAEIQRLIGRSLRAAVDLDALGDRTITVDCDVLQGDGGTRTASVTGGFIALAIACRRLVKSGALEKDPIRGCVAAVSAGVVDNVPLLDLCYEEDSGAMVDLNCVMNEAGELIELQGTGEGRAFTVAEQQTLVSLCAGGVKQLIALQKEILGGLT